MLFYDRQFYKRLTQEKKDRYDAFLYYLRKELNLIRTQVFDVLSRGYDEMVAKDKEAYYNSEGYKKAKAKRDENKKDNSGVNDGIEEMHQKLGYWVPAKRPTGAYYHITYSTPDSDDELRYIPILKSGYVETKAIKLAKKYDKSTLTGMVFYALTNHGETPFLYKEEFQWFCYRHYEEENFCLKEHLTELYEVFPNAIRKGKIVLDRIPVVENGNTVCAYILQNQRYTTINVNLEKFPSHDDIIGKFMGDTFKLPGIDLTYRIEFIY